jgi:LysR family glycine cleavage system transcriptional activator
MSDAPGKLPSLNGVKVFEVAARHLNFRLAAEELGVTQGAVAQQIRGLEAELGVKLFERLPRALALTGEGRAYIADVRRALEIIARATDGLKPQPVRLTISTTPSFASRWLIPRLPDFTARHPDLDLHILATDRMSSFQADGVDLAVRYGRPPFGPGLAVELLFEQEIVAVCSPMLLAGRPAPKTAGNWPATRCCTTPIISGRSSSSGISAAAGRPRSRASASTRLRTRSRRRRQARGSFLPTAISSRAISPRGGSSGCSRAR